MPTMNPSSTLGARRPLSITRGRKDGVVRLLRTRSETRKTITMRLTHGWKMSVRRLW